MSPDLHSDDAAPSRGQLTAYHHVYLVPGFFGFANLGELKYFAHVRDHLTRYFDSRGKRVEIHYVRTLPTASLSRRAARLAETIRDTTDKRAAIHLVGHSSGGLDARMLAAPGSPWSTEQFTNRIRTVVTVATPHHGVPQVSSLTGATGGAVLKVLSLLTYHGIRLGSVPLPALVGLAGVLPRLGGRQGPLLSILDQIYRTLIRDFDEVRQRELEEFFLQTTEDQGLIEQLSPAEMEEFNRQTPMEPSIGYGCVVAQGAAPSWRSAIKIGFAPSEQATYAVYRALYLLAAQMDPARVPAPSEQQESFLRTAFGEYPGREANDGIVPTLSQVHGEVIHAAWADHLDVVGHFGDTTTRPPHVEWVVSNSGFAVTDFEELWQAVAGFILRAPNDAADK